MNSGAAGIGNGQTSATQPYIRVVGRGTVRVVPDIARVTMGIQVEAGTAREASTRCAEAMRRVLDVLVAQGVASRDVHTSHLSITPQYDYSQGKQRRRIGHSASNNVQATLRALDRVGAILDAVIEAGGDDVTVQSMQLAASDTSAAQIEARHAALADARAQAQDTADTMGFGLGQPLAVEFGSMGGIPLQPRFPLAQMARVSSSSAQPVEAGEMEVASQVEILFAIV